MAGLCSGRFSSAFSCCFHGKYHYHSTYILLILYLLVAAFLKFSWKGQERVGLWSKMLMAAHDEVGMREKKGKRVPPWRSTRVMKYSFNKRFIDLTWGQLTRHNFYLQLVCSTVLKKVVASNYMLQLLATTHQNLHTIRSVKTKKYFQIMYSRAMGFILFRLTF